MPNYLALEWGRAGFRGLDAEVTGGTVHVRASLAHDWPEELDAASDFEGVGNWLKSRIQELGQAERRLIVLVSREDVAMRLLALPQASDETIPDLVRYQTGARSSVPLDQLVLDYLPVASSPPQGGRWVQTATVPARLLGHIQACAKVAGLELCFVGMTTVALGEAIAHAERLRKLPADQTTLVVHVDGERVEVALWRGADLLFSHMARAADSQAAAVEAQRALMSHENTVGDGGIERAWLISSTDIETELQTTLATRLGCEVIVFDRSRDIPKSVRTTGLEVDARPLVTALGALLARIQATVPTIDFLNPRRREVKPNRIRMFAAVAVGGLLLLLAAGYAASRLYQHRLDGMIADKETIVRQQDEYLEQGEPARETMAFLSPWELQRVDWLNQMQRIGAEMPGTDRVYLDRWRFDRGTGSSLGTTEAIGFARHRQDAQQLTQRLAEQPGFRIRPNSNGAASSDPDYPTLFQLNAGLVIPDRRPASKERE